MLYGTHDVTRDMLGIQTRSDILRQDEFWAVNDVSFELKPGDSLGIVGSNGSGKSTLLKMLNGIILPDKGQIRIKGKVGALIEVGAGFHPLLTGRENIYVNGAILGMSRADIKSKFDSIVDFAGIGDFLDMPVKNYSSGMYVRLGFAIAAHMEPGILLVDEVLAVGDVNFQKKCFKFIEETILGKGIILCFVSHSIYTINRLCSKALLLHNGDIQYYGDSKGVVPSYYRSMRTTAAGGSSAPNQAIDERQGAGEVRITKVEMMDGTGAAASSISTGDPVEFRFHLRVARDMNLIPQAFLKISDLSGTVIAYSMIPGDKKDTMNLKKGDNILSCTYPSFYLMPGSYVLDIKLGGGDDIIQDILPEAKRIEVIGADAVFETTGANGMVYLQNEWHTETPTARGA